MSLPQRAQRNEVTDDTDGHGWRAKILHATRAQFGSTWIFYAVRRGIVVPLSQQFMMKEAAR